MASSKESIIRASPVAMGRRSWRRCRRRRTVNQFGRPARLRLGPTGHVERHVISPGLPAGRAGSSPGELRTFMPHSRFGPGGNLAQPSGSEAVRSVWFGEPGPCHSRVRSPRECRSRRCERGAERTGGWQPLRTLTRVALLPAERTTSYEEGIQQIRLAILSGPLSLRTVRCRLGKRTHCARERRVEHETTSRESRGTPA